MADVKDGYVLVTGASGYVGQFVARRLAERGFRVAGTYLTHPVDLGAIDMLPIDLSDYGAVGRLFRDMRPVAVVHLAAETKVGWCEEHPSDARAAIYDATENLCASIASRAPATRMIHFSTDLVFGGELAPCDEDTPAKPLSRYGSLKYASELPVLQLENAVVLRSALVYGPPAIRRASFLGWMVDTLRSHQPLTLFEDEWRTPVFVEDLVDAVEKLLDSKEEGVFHAGGPDRLSRVEMGRAVCQVFGLGEEGIQVARRHDAPGGDKRPRDVSLTCNRLAATGWRQTSFLDGITQCRELWPQTS